MVSRDPCRTHPRRARLLATLAISATTVAAPSSAEFESEVFLSDFSTADLCTSGWSDVTGEVPECVCSNGLLDPGEECDDGNLAPGDGCTGFCLYEPVAEVEPNDDGSLSIGGGATGNDFSAANANGPFAVTPGNRLISAAISPAGDEDCFAVVNDSGSARLLSAETYGAGWGVCSGVDTILVARDDTSAVITSDDESGIGSCSKLTDLALAAGETIYLQVLDFGDNSTVAGYRLELRFSTPP